MVATHPLSALCIEHLATSSSFYFNVLFNNLNLIFYINVHINLKLFDNNLDPKVYIHKHIKTQNLINMNLNLKFRMNVHKTSKYIS